MKKYSKNILVLFSLLILFTSYTNKDVNGNYFKDKTTTTSGTYTIQDTGQDVCIIHSAGATASKTFALPSNPVDGQIVMLCFDTAITTLTLTFSGGTIGNAPTTAAAGQNYAFIYNVSDTKFYLMP